ncbi:divalent-cation tolerance protein CutA, partial [Acinetobacter baumannii]|uniref:divalent-cation tolerance protein CutA n=2 Tax=Acinetobacter baumannii TaxID=470 RepID=UPI001D174633
NLRIHLYATEMGRARRLSRAARGCPPGPPDRGSRYPMPVSALICFCTCPDADSAERIATALVAERLAACVNLLPGLRSVYRWQRKVEAAAEVLLLVKTSAEAYPALQERLRQLHPYELPELLAVEAASGLPEYLQWLAAESRPVN